MKIRWAYLLLSWERGEERSISPVEPIAAIARVPWLSSNRVNNMGNTLDSSDSGTGSDAYLGSYVSKVIEGHDQWDHRRFLGFFENDNSPLYRDDQNSTKRDWSKHEKHVLREVDDRSSSSRTDMLPESVRESCCRGVEFKRGTCWTVTVLGTRGSVFSVAGWMGTSTLALLIFVAEDSFTLTDWDRRGSRATRLTRATAVDVDVALLIICQNCDAGVLFTLKFDGVYMQRTINTHWIWGLLDDDVKMKINHSNLIRMETSQEN